MHLDSTVWTLLSLCALSGALHVIAPDHWMPASVMSWQRGWTPRQTARFTSLIFAAHTALGFLLFLAFRQLAHFAPFAPRLFGLSLVLVALACAWRLSRFQKVREILLAGPESARGSVLVLTLLGPCEYLVPILLKSGSLGFGYLLPSLTFGLFSAAAATGVVVVSRAFWNRPLWLPRSLNWGQNPGAILPVITGLAVGLAAILRLG